MQNPLSAWDATRRIRYAGTRWHPTIHLLLDASGSMAPHVKDIVRSYGAYLRHLQQIAPPGTMLDQRCFAYTVPPRVLQPLHAASPMAYEVGGGTRLYRAVHNVIDQDDINDHLLVIFSDGISEEPACLASELAAFFATEAGAQWLPVFLGAFPEALSVGMGMGIAEGNCLCFGASEWPEAFRRLREGTDRYLTAATPAQRRLITTGGLFA